ncbi:MAG TPA: hypothetical protein VGW09_06630 [Nitrososphaeraceae archaeon]|nr:hypothetical protein [Nitrososphaeraceae archaeon]
MSKPNWACSACGMYSGRKESVLRHIRNKNVHNGYASVIPFVDSLTVRQSSSYRGQYEGRKNLFSHPITGFEHFQKALSEKLAEKLAEKWVSARPQFQPQPSYPQPSIHNHLNSFFADTEYLFGIEARICNLSSVIEPLKILYTESKDHRLDKQLLCSHLNSLSGFQPVQDSSRCEADTHALAFVSPLKRWVDDALSTTKQKKIVALRIPEPERKNGVSIVRVVTDRSSLHSDMKAHVNVNLEYSAQTCQELLVDDEDTILSSWSRRVIENGSTFLSELEIIDYLMATKKSKFGFFRIRARDRNSALYRNYEGSLYLVMLVFNIKTPTILRNYPVA